MDNGPTVDNLILELTRDEALTLLQALGYDVKPATPGEGRGGLLMRMERAIDEALRGMLIPAEDGTALTLTVRVIIEGGRVDGAFVVKAKYPS